MFAYIINLKMDLAQNSIPFGRFFLVLWRKNLLSSFAGNWSFFYKFSATSAITKFWIRQKWRLPVNVHGIWFLFIFINYTKKESCTKFYGVLDNFSWSYYVNWFKTIRRSLDACDIVPTNEFFFHDILFYDKKDHIKQNSYFWSQFYFNLTQFNFLFPNALFFR